MSNLGVNVCVASLKEGLGSSATYAVRAFKGDLSDV